MKKLYDADYIIRKNNEYEELRIYNSPAEKKLREMIAENARLCEIENEKCRIRKAKLEARKLEKRMMVESGLGMEM